MPFENDRGGGEVCVFLCVCVLVHLCRQDMTGHCSQTRAGSSEYDLACQTFLLNAALRSAI